MAEVLGPVETIRAAAEKLRQEPSDPWWWDGLVHPGVAEPLADWLDADAYRLDQLLNGPNRGTAYPAAEELTEEYHGEALRVARVLLGVPDATP